VLFFFVSFFFGFSKDDKAISIASLPIIDKSHDVLGCEIQFKATPRVLCLRLRFVLILRPPSARSTAPSAPTNHIYSDSQTIIAFAKAITWTRFIDYFDNINYWIWCGN